MFKQVVGTIFIIIISLIIKSIVVRREMIEKIMER